MLSAWQVCATPPCGAMQASQSSALQCRRYSRGAAATRPCWGYSNRARKAVANPLAAAATQTPATVITVRHLFCGAIARQTRCCDLSVCAWEAMARAEALITMATRFSMGVMV